VWLIWFISVVFVGGEESAVAFCCTIKVIAAGFVYVWLLAFCGWPHMEEYKIWSVTWQTRAIQND